MRTLKMTCVIQGTFTLSTFKVKIIIYQSFNVKIFLNTIPPINFKNTFDLLLRHKSFSNFVYDIL
jgi:hypothetical protein